MTEVTGLLPPNSTQVEAPFSLVPLTFVPPYLPQQQKCGARAWCCVVRTSVPLAFSHVFPRRARPQPLFIRVWDFKGFQVRCAILTAIALSVSLSRLFWVHAMMAFSFDVTALDEYPSSATRLSLMAWHLTLGTWEALKFWNRKL